MSESFSGAGQDFFSVKPEPEIDFKEYRAIGLRGFVGLLGPIWLLGVMGIRGLIGL